MNKITKILLSLLLGSILIFAGCVNQKFNTPPETCEDTDAPQANITIADLKALLPADKPYIQITDDYVISGYVISTDKYGNFYKELVIEDTTAGISIMLDRSYLYTIYPQGQRIVVKLKGMYLGRSGGVVKLGGLYEQDGVVNFGRLAGEAIIDQHLIATCENQMPQAKTITISQISDQYLYQYVQFEGVQFPAPELKITWANPYADPPQSVAHHIQDASYNEALVYTSGYASFAGQPVPQGNGTFRAVLTKYNGTYQLVVNTPDELNMEGERPFDTFLSEDFEGGEIPADWSNIKVLGDIAWFVNYYSGNNYAKITNYDYATSSNSACETWLITPSMDLSFSNSIGFTFDNDVRYFGPALQVKISTDWDGDPATLSSATWTTLNPILDTDDSNYGWVNSGVVNISAYNKENVHIAFIYTGSDSDGATWMLDNIKVFTN